VSKHVGVSITQRDYCDIYFYSIIVHFLVIGKNNDNDYDEDDDDDNVFTTVNNEIFCLD